MHTVLLFFLVVVVDSWQLMSSGFHNFFFLGSTSEDGVSVHHMVLLRCQAYIKCTCSILVMWKTFLYPICIFLYFFIYITSGKRKLINFVHNFVTLGHLTHTSHLPQNKYMTQFFN